MYPEEIDITPYTAVVTDVGVAIPLVGVGLMTVTVAIGTVFFVTGWAGKLLKAARGRGGG